LFLFLFYVIRNVDFYLNGEKMSYFITCWNCTAEFDLAEADFCSHSNPTKVCPFCLSCYCNASEEYKNKIIENGPQELRDEREKAENNRYRKLGEILLNAKRITKEQLDEAIEKQVYVNKKLGEILIMLGYVSEEELNLYLLGQQWIDTIDLKKQKINFALIERIGAEFCMRYKAIPLELFDIKGEWVLRIVLFDTNKLSEIKEIEELKDVRIIPYRADASDIKKVLIKIKKFFDEDKILVLS